MAFYDNNFRNNRQEFGCPACGCQLVYRTESKTISILYDASGNEIEIDEHAIGKFDPGKCNNCDAIFDEDKWAADINRQ